MVKLTPGNDYFDDLPYGYNEIYSGAGNDTVLGWDGDDYIDDITVKGIGGGGDDVFYGEQGNDTLYGWDGNDSLYGGADDDYIYGEAGNDVCVGGAGKDYLSGGAGWDKYVYNSDSESTPASMDTIADFDFGSSQATGDKIDLSGIYSGTLTWGWDVYTENEDASANSDTIVWAWGDNAWMKCEVKDGAFDAGSWLAIDFIL